MSKFWQAVPQGGDFAGVGVHAVADGVVDGLEQLVQLLVPGKQGPNIIARNDYGAEMNLTKRRLGYSEWGPSNMRRRSPPSSLRI